MPGKLLQRPEISEYMHLVQFITKVITLSGFQKFVYLWKHWSSKCTKENTHKVKKKSYTDCFQFKMKPLFFNLKLYIIWYLSNIPQAILSEGKQRQVHLLLNSSGTKMKEQNYLTILTNHKFTANNWLYRVIPVLESNCIKKYA